jgi:hypothetical protein
MISRHKMSDRNKRLQKIYEIIGVKPENIIEKPSLESDIKPNFTSKTNLNDDLIATHTDLFFEDPQNGWAYMQHHGIVKAMKLFETYGQNFVLDDWKNINFHAQKTCDFCSDSFVYFVENYQHEIDYQILANSFIQLYNLFDKNMIFALEYCIEHGALSDVISKSLTDYFAGGADRMYLSDFLIAYSDRILECINHPILKIDVNEIISKMNICFEYNNSCRRTSIAKWLTTFQLDYSNPKVVDFAIFASINEKTSDDLVQIMSTLNNFYAQDLNIESLLKAIAMQISCSENSINWLSDGKIENFLDIFAPYGVDYYKIFDDYINENRSTPEQMLKCKSLLTHLAKRKNLIL